MGCSSSTMSSDIPKEKITIGYWALPLLAQPLRFLLELTEIPYQEKLYNGQNNEWTNKDKLNLGLDYPNLPYLIQGDLKLTESQNLVNYVIDISGQTGLNGKGKDKYTVDNIRFVCHDLILSVHRTSVKPEEEKRSAYEKDVYQKAIQLKNQLNGKTKFFSQITAADIYFYSFAFYFKQVLPDQYREFAHQFDPFLAEFESIPQISNYLSSERYKKINPNFVPTKKRTQDKIKLGYWALTLLAQPIRYVLELASAEYEDKHYEGDDWFAKDKQNLGLDYPNLPYLIQGNNKITESINILNYVVEETNQPSLHGNSKTKYEVNNLTFVLKDLLMEVYKTKDLPLSEQQQYFDKQVLPKFNLVKKDLGNRNQFFTNLTVADIFYYTTVKNMKMWIPKIYTQHEKDVAGFMANFESIPQIQKYHKSNKYLKVTQQIS